MKKVDCPKCEGYGKFFMGHEAGFNVKSMEVFAKEVITPCFHCDGSGSVKGECDECSEQMGLDYFKDKRKEVFLLCPCCAIDFVSRNNDEPDLDPYPNRLWPECEMN